MDQSFFDGPNESRAVINQASVHLNERGPCFDPFKRIFGARNAHHADYRHFSVGLAIQIANQAIGSIANRPTTEASVSNFRQAFSLRGKAISVRCRVRGDKSVHAVCQGHQ